MTLTLTITNVDRLENGASTRLVLDRHGAAIGRSPHVDWSLPDPRNHISSTHCEIQFRDGQYVLIDKSTNGSFVNGDSSRVLGPHPIADGDEIMIGHYRIEASLSGAKARTPAKPAGGEGWGGWGPANSGVQASPAAPASSPGWDQPRPGEAGSNRWGDGASQQQAFSPMPPSPSRPAAPDAWGDSPAAAQSGWGAESAGIGGSAHEAAGRWTEPGAEITGRGAMSDAWAPPAISQPASEARSGWGSTTPTPAALPSTAADDVWSRLSNSHQVDWGRSDLTGSPQAQPPVQPASPPRSVPQVQAPAPTDAAWAALVVAAGLAPSDIQRAPPEAAAAAGALLRRLIAGMVDMLEARARAKAQLGAQATALEFDGNNPLKFARSPERALAQLLNDQERGFMSADRAVEDAFHDLQAHQMATLAAMQSALRSTLERFSPAAIRGRAETRGLLAKIIPGARDAELWRIYEREFEGVARGSDEAFMDVFARAFREAYERSAASMRRR